MTPQGRVWPWPLAPVGYSGRMKLLSVLIPIVAPIVVLSSGAAVAQQPGERTIPERFHGEWNSRLADCGTGASDSLLVLSANEIQFYESSGPVRGAFLNGPREILIVTDLSGEEETDLTAFKFFLSADGNRLEYRSESEAPFVRHRCPASKSLRP